MSLKVKALRTNLDFLKAFPDGPCGFVEYLATMATTRERVDYLCRNISYIKAKGARDFLTTGLGMATDVIALDSRVMGIVTSIVPDLPAKVTYKNYDVIEAFLVEQFCRPLGMQLVQFDQLFLLNQRAIDGGLGSGVATSGVMALSTMTLDELLRWQVAIAAEIESRGSLI